MGLTHGTGGRNNTRHDVFMDGRMNPKKMILIYDLYMKDFCEEKNLPTALIFLSGFNLNFQYFFKGNFFPVAILLLFLEDMYFALSRLVFNSLSTFVGSEVAYLHLF